VDVFEKGPAYPYPHDDQFEQRVRLRSPRPLYRKPPGLTGLSTSGDYPAHLAGELDSVEGGMASRWEAICLRRPPQEFRTRTLYGYGHDWPLDYDDLEPWYGRAETLLGVAGTDADNPFAPPRSTPHPLPPFPLAWDDRWLAERLEADGLHLHTTPQARTREPYDGRLECVNFGTCSVCPIGARYSPHLHLERAVATGRVRLHTNTAVRRVLTDRAGRARGLLVRPADGGGTEREHPADRIVIAAGALESARLLLLSTAPGHPDGLGNRTGAVGRDLVFHHMWLGRLRFREALYPGRFGGWTGQSHQFLDPPGRGRHGGVKLELSSRRAYATHEPVRVWETPGDVLGEAETADDVARALAPTRHWRPITFHAEARPGPETESAKHLTLGAARDRFGDPVAHVHYELDDFDRETHRFCRELFERFRKASGADDGVLADAGTYYSGFHHMGTCRMGVDQTDGVTDSFGRVHGVPGLAVAGGALFAGSGTVNPTLTMVALALRLADRLADDAR
jgi:choline dehydrogenase-like flavoprotein